MTGRFILTFESQKDPEDIGRARGHGLLFGLSR